MNISRNFLLIGALYLIFGMGLGMYMGGSSDYTQSILHAHINLLGFTLMSIFGLVYRMIPAMAGSGLARVHFWLHQVGVLVAMIMLYFILAGQVSEESNIILITPVAELGILVGTVLFALNLYRNAA